jgi:hypothetical protein
MAVLSLFSAELIDLFLPLTGAAYRGGISDHCAAPPTAGPKSAHIDLLTLDYLKPGLKLSHRPCRGVYFAHAPVSPGDVQRGITAVTSESINRGLKTRHVFLDTEVYKRYGHNLNDKVLQRLLQLTKDQISTLHITDITLAEIERQLGDMAIEIAQAVNKGNRLLRNWRSVRSWHAENQEVSADLEAATLTRDAVTGFDFTMKIRWQPTRHDALNIPTKETMPSA